jgi:hypothetical protein
VEGIRSVEEEHATDMQDLLRAHEGKPSLGERTQARTHAWAGLALALIRADEDRLGCRSLWRFSA